MNFFKRLFSSDKKETAHGVSDNNEQNGNIKEVYTNEYFDKRYTEDDIEAGMLDGSLKMIESYFMDNKIERKINQPINHPLNLDQVVDDGFGFGLYCKAFNLGDSEATLFLTLAFNDYLIKNYGFKMYRDNQPEYPLRTMTLKYDKEGAVLSLYPFEYAAKVMNYEATFENLYQRIEGQLQKMPSVDDLLKGIKDQDEE